MFVRKVSRPIDKVIIHCTATKEGQDVSVETIRKWHQARNWKDIGYHYVISRNGQVHTGRDLASVGAHCFRQNRGSIGIVYVGGLDENGKAKDTRTFEQNIGFIYLLRMIKYHYPEATIHGHNEFSNKACPCFDAQIEYGWIESEENEEQ